MADEARNNPIRRLAALPPPWRARALADLTLEQQRELAARWQAWAHPGQIAPEGNWRVWLIRAGRGFGKTRAGAEWVTGFARDNKHARIALVGATAEDVRSVMIEGPSGLIAVAADDEPVTWRSAAHELRFASGAKAFVYSAAAPEKLRGPEHDLAWCDELAKWRYGDAAWDNLMLGMRLGDAPRVLVTTTPRPVALLRRIIADRATVETRGRTQDNPHLPASFVAAMEETYGGTRLGRQELDGELIDDVAGALWSRDLIERCRVAAVPELVRVVVGVDPPAGIGGDACGIVALGLGRNDHGYVIDDASVAGATPEGWAQAVAACAARHRADRVIAEANQGGAMVMAVLTAADAGLPVTLVHASRGKAARAEPVATLYEGGKMHHAGAFAALEDELCGLIAGGGYEGPGRSPDRADALVWAASELMLGRRGRARVLGL
ncbi:DNA-packaging protein [Hephaestia sp. GCM10023244]|uniref:DNA-packaging protein n=1 Tax=unclassified Hephaestia TaxID=2631281 RepID=UPI0020777110|nr:terminase family protein [Hephaestia sp. MAHUQ-44]MCM8729693.1 terminase family protein [Hephaestia sp. MAHUQ-44]